jgi:hypothetical protein
VVRRSTGLPPFAANENWTSSRSYGQRGTHFANLAGTESINAPLADQIIVNTERIYVRRSTNSAFAESGSPWSPPTFGAR